jgi:hypothetical protein
VLQRDWLIAGFAWVGLFLPVFAQDTVALKWEFEKGKPFYQEWTTETKQTMKVMGKDITQNQKQTFIFSYRPKDQDKDKNWIVTQKIEDADTGNPNPPAGFLKALVGSEFELTISPKLTILTIKGREDFVSRLVKANPQMELLLKQLLSEDAMKQMAETIFAAVPEKPVKNGDAWEKKSSSNMGPIGGYDTTSKYTYEGKDDKLHKIKVETAVRYHPPEAKADGDLPFKIKAARLESKGGNGIVLFDNEKHRLENSELNLRLEGEFTLDISGQTTTVNLTQDQTTTIKMSDQNPAVKK